MPNLPMRSYSARNACGVPQCTKRARYTCPRCSSPYCSVPCYRAHSQGCVNGFAEDATAPLHGQTTFRAHRKRFNQMLERMRQQPDSPFANSGHEYFSDSDGSDDVPETALCNPALQSNSATATANSNTHVLEQLLHSLDEPGRESFFTVLNSAMENTYGRKPLSPQEPPKPGSPHAIQVDEENNCASNKKSPDDIAETLEMLVEEMETLELSYDDILARLPDFLRKDFEKRLQDGGADHLIPTWIPWWYTIGHVVRSNSSALHQPSPLPPLPTARQLTVPLHVPKKNASLYLRYSVVDVLASYTVSLRFCNGEWWGDTLAARSIWQISAVLSKDARYVSLEEVCAALVETISKAENHSVAVQALRDTAELIRGGSDWVARAAYECQCILEAGSKHAGSGKAEIRNRVRKVGYFVAWALCQESEVFELLARKILTQADLESGLAEEIKIAARVQKGRSIRKITVIE